MMILFQKLIPEGLKKNSFKRMILREVILEKQLNQILSWLKNKIQKSIGRMNLALKKEVNNTKM